MKHLSTGIVFLAALSLTPSLAFAQEIGIAACDDFIAKYEACITGKLPAETQAQFTGALTEWRTEWKKLAADPNNNMILTGVCNQMQEQTKASLTPYGCAF
jgi:hypothetical protein